MLTEQPNPITSRIDQVSTLELTRLINAEDARVAQAIAQQLPAIARAIDAIVQGIENGGRLLYIGAGTSGRLGVLDAVECVPTYGTPPELVQGIIAGGEGALTHAVEGAEDDQQQGAADLRAIQLTAQDVVCGLAASGHTPYVLGALHYANELGAQTIGIACNVPSPLLEIAHIAIGVEVGPEVIAGSTRMKAGTAQKMVLNMLSTGSMVKLGKVYGNLMVDVQITNEKLAQRARGLVQTIAGVEEARAQALLQEAASHVKTAIVMHKKEVSAAEARQLLAAANGHLRAVIG